MDTIGKEMSQWEKYNLKVDSFVFFFFDRKYAEKFISSNTRCFQLLLCSCGIPRAENPAQAPLYLYVVRQTRNSSLKSKYASTWKSRTNTISKVCQLQGRLSCGHCWIWWVLENIEESYSFGEKKLLSLNFVLAESSPDLRCFRHILKFWIWFVSQKGINFFKNVCRIVYKQWSFHRRLRVSLSIERYSQLAHLLSNQSPSEFAHYPISVSSHLNLTSIQIC